MSKTKTKKQSPGHVVEKPTIGCSFVPAFADENSPQRRKARATDNGENFDASQTFEHIAKVILESGHYDESGFCLHDALSLRGELSDADCRVEFGKFVQELMAKGIVKEVHGCMNFPTYQFKIFGQNRRTIQTDAPTVAGFRLR